ncbi:MAG: PilX N-terminal domain-containing pilus assembly protein [bacterium]
MKNGFAILTVVFVIVSFAVLGVAAVSMIAGSSKMLMDDYQSAQAFYVAEAGVAYTAEQLMGDGDWSDNAGFTKDFGPGSFTVSYVNKDANTVTIQVDGTVGAITRRIQQQLSSSGSAAFDHGLYAVGSISSGGSSSGFVTGPVSAGGSFSQGGGVVFDGEVENNNASAAIPVPDWSYWEGIADHVISGNYTFSPGTYDGIYYITGSATINNDVTLNGTIVTYGSISCAGNGNISITAAAGNPAILAGGSLSFSGTSNLAILGWVFAVGSATFTGNSDVTVQGGVTAGGSVDITGNTDIGLTFNQSLAPVAGFNGGERAGISFGQWRESY